MDWMRFAVLGLGFMGSTHLKALQSIPDAELVAVCSSDEKKLSGDLTGIQGNVGGQGERLDFSGLSRYREISEVLNDPRVEAVDICLPTYLHAPVAMEAVRRAKHVLVEKPMALDARSAREMIAEAEQHKRVLMVAQVLRFFPMYQALSDILASGRIGVARSLVFRRRCAAPVWGGWLKDPAKSGGGVFDLLIHDIDMCLHLCGEPEAISASGYEALDAGVDIITAALHYPEGRTAIVTGGWHHPKSYPFSMEYTVVADGGTLDYSSAGRPPTLYRADGAIEELALEDVDGYRAEIEYFQECCKTNSSPDRCPPRQSAAAVALARQILEARNRNGERIRCDL
jgi:predicted dehydrogenase